VTDIADVETGEIVEVLTEAQARDLLDAIKVNLEDAADLADQLWAGRGWVALGYGSWDDMCKAEIRPRMPRLERAERKAIVADMAAKGMSTRAIAAAVGVHHDTVAEDIKQAAPVGNPTPAPVTGLDGKTYERKPRHIVQPAPEAPGVAEARQKRARLLSSLAVVTAALQQLNEAGVDLDPGPFLAELSAAVERHLKEQQS
jgi:hypothetical protein